MIRKLLLIDGVSLGVFCALSAVGPFLRMWLVCIPMRFMVSADAISFVGGVEPSHIFAAFMRDDLQ